MAHELTASFEASSELVLDPFFRDSEQDSRFALGPQLELAQNNDFTAARGQGVDRIDQEKYLLLATEALWYGRRLIAGIHVIQIRHARKRRPTLVTERIDREPVRD